MSIAPKEKENPKEKTTKLILHGYFISYDKYDRAKIMFLDDYDLGDFDKKSINDNNHQFTKSYIINKSAKTDGKNPLTDGNTCFNIKFGKNKVGFIDDKPVPLYDLKQHKVTIQAEIQKYNFTKVGNLIQGWNIKMLKMSLLEL